MSGPPDRTVALVTGAAQGIGLGIARSLASASYKVVLADIDDEIWSSGPRAALRAEGFEAIGEHLDVTRADDWEQAVGHLIARWGGLDVLVNCAGISPRGTAESTDEALWERTLGINLKGAWLGIKAALPSLRSRGGHDPEHRLDASDSSHAGAVLLRGQQGRPLGPDAAGGRRVPDRGRDLQHGRARMGRHAQRATNPGPVRTSRISRPVSAT